MGRQYRHDRRVRQQRWEKPACADPDSAQYEHHHWTEWGADARFRRCRRCGTVSAEDISDEARYARVPITERRMAHHHLFEPSLLDTRYERCSCGATRRVESTAESTAENASDNAAKNAAESAGAA